MDLDQLRAQTPGCLHRIHLNNAGAALMSRSTLAAMTTHLQLEAEVGGYEAAELAREQIDVAYAALAQLLGGRRDELALFDNSTHAWNAAFYSIPLGPGDRIRRAATSTAAACWPTCRSPGARAHRPRGRRLVPTGRHPGRRPVPGGRGFTWADGARRFETWENSYVNIIGLGAAVQQALELGLDAIGDRTRTLGERLREDLRQLPGVTTHDLGTHRCAIVSAKITGRSPEYVAAALRRAGINVSTTVAQHNPLDTDEVLPGPQFRAQRARRARRGGRPGAALAALHGQAA